MRYAQNERKLDTCQLQLKGYKMPKSIVKQLHALVDELADAGQEEMLTALHTIMAAQAEATASDADLDLDTGDEEEDKPRRGRSGKRSAGTRRRRASAEADDEADEADEEGDDDDLDDLSDLDVDDDEEDTKPARGRRGSKSKTKPTRGRRSAKAEVADEDDDGDEDDGEDLPEFKPGKNAAKAFDAFLDEMDDAVCEEAEGGVRELQKAAVDTYGIDLNSMDFGIKGSGREARKDKQVAFAQFMGRMEYITGQLVAAGVEVLEELYEEHTGESPEDVKGRGNARLNKLAHGILGGVYGEDGDE